MARKKEQYESEILEIIKKYNLMYISNIFAFYTGIRPSQFYNLKLEKSDILLKALDDNKIKTKHSMKNKWFQSNNPTLQIALYKLIGTEDEAHRLNGSKQEIRQDVEQKIQVFTLDGKEITL